MPVVNLKKFNENIDRDKKLFQECDPYPCITFDEFVDEDYLTGFADEIRQLVFSQNNIFNPFIHYNAKVWGTIRRIGFSERMNGIVDSFQSPEFMKYLEKLTGVEKLIADEDLITGGYVVHKKNGYVHLHVDHRTHPEEKKWDRKVLLLYYLNDNYKEEYNGSLEVWNPKVTKRILNIAPLYNRCVIQTIDDGYVHGLPEIMNFPEGDCRKALVLWYYVEKPENIPLRVTKYYPRPKDKFLTKLFIIGENTLLHFHYVIKRIFKSDDNYYIKIQRFFRK